MRLFVSIGLSSETKTQLFSAMDALRQQGCGQFTPPENLHLTLVFLGETEKLDAAKDAVSSVCAKPFSISIEGIGAFGDLIWAGVSPAPELLSLQQELVGRLRDAGFSPEEREFIPHITLVRRFVPNVELDPSPVTEALGSRLCSVSGITLMESLRENGKQRYYPLFTKAL